MLTLLFEKQAQTLFDASSGMLNLAHFKECPDLESVQKSVDFSTVAFCRSLVAVIQAKLGLPRFINLNNNNITTLTMFLGALVDANLHDSVGGISACNNNLTDFKFLGPLKKFTNLQELVLAGNDISSKPNYVKEITRALPGLLGLDGQSVRRPPLALPYPIRPPLSQEAVSVLQMLEVSLLQQLSAKNLDTLLSLYHTDALFSFTFGSRFKFKSFPMSNSNKGNKSLANDLHARSRSSEHRRDLLDIHGMKNFSKGKAKIQLAQQNNVYLKNFDVLHHVDGAANVVFLSDAMKVPTCIVTIHGKMQWVHNKCRDEVQVACFDRTFALVFTTAWEITNDMLNIREEKHEPLSFPDNPSNIALLQRKLGLEESIVQAVVKQANSESDLAWMLADLTPQVIQECAPYASGDANKLVSLARVAAQRQVDAKSAFGMLSATGFDVTAALGQPQQVPG